MHLLRFFRLLQFAGGRPAHFSQLRDGNQSLLEQDVLCESNAAKTICFSCTCAFHLLVIVQLSGNHWRSPFARVVGIHNVPQP